MRHILFIAMDLNSGGAERQMVSIACGLKKRGHNVSFVCYQYGDFYGDKLREEGISITWLIKKSVIGRLLSYRRFIRGGGFDVVISFLETPNILNCFAAIGPHSWKVITGERSAKEDLLKTRRGRVVARLQKYADVLVCNSFNSAEMWRKTYPFLGKKITTIYNMVIVGKPSGVFCNTNDPQKTSILVAASYQYLKNPLNVVKAISLLSDDEKQRISLDWYGNPNTFPSAFGDMLSLVQDLDLGSIVTLHEASKEIYEKMMEADFIGLFSCVEGLPNAICEGMMLGKPIIFSRVSDYKILVQGNGLLCDGNSPDSIRDVFKQALSLTRDRRNVMGEKSRELAKGLFGEDIILSQWETVIES